MKLEHTTALDAKCEIRRMTGEELLSVHVQNPDKRLFRKLVHIGQKCLTLNQAAWPHNKPPST